MNRPHQESQARCLHEFLRSRRRVDYFQIEFEGGGVYFLLRARWTSGDVVLTTSEAGPIWSMMLLRMSLQTLMME